MKITNKLYSNKGFQAGTSGSPKIEATTAGSTVTGILDATVGVTTPGTWTGPWSDTALSQFSALPWKQHITNYGFMQQVSNGALYLGAGTEAYHKIDGVNVLELTVGAVTVPNGIDFKITTGAGFGKILTSSSTGLATWETPSVVATPTLQAVTTQSATTDVYTVFTGGANTYAKSITNTRFGDCMPLITPTGSGNTNIGYLAGIAATTGASSVAIGKEASKAATTGSYFVSIGSRSAWTNVAGSEYVAIGSYAGGQSQQNDFVAIGRSAASASTGTGIVAIGPYAGRSASTGQSWTAIGDRAGSSVTTGSNWSALGFDSGSRMLSANGWTGLGWYAGNRCASGSGNWVVIGSGAATNNADSSYATDFSEGVYIGGSTRVSAIGATNEIVIGYSAIGSGTNTVSIGNTSITDNYFMGKVHVPTLKVGTTSVAGQVLTADTVGNAIWAAAATPETPSLQVVTETGATTNVYTTFTGGAGSGVDTRTRFGFNAGLGNSTAGEWVAIGSNAGLVNTSGDWWVAIGHNAGSSSVSGWGWTAIGRDAGKLNTSDQWTAVGYRAGGSNVSEGAWTAIGSSAAHSNISGTKFTAVGDLAGGSNKTGSFWTAVGFASGGEGSDFISIGYGSGASTGNNYVAIGKDSGGRTVLDVPATGFSNSVYVGNNTRISASGVTNENVFGHEAGGKGANTVAIGNSNITDNYFSGMIHADTIRLNTGAADGALLRSDASGNATWQTNINEDYPDNYRVLSNRTGNIIEDVANERDTTLKLPVSKFDGIDNTHITVSTPIYRTVSIELYFNTNINTELRDLFKIGTMAFAIFTGENIRVYHGSTGTSVFSNTGTVIKNTKYKLNSTINYDTGHVLLKLNDIVVMDEVVLDDFSNVQTALRISTSTTTRTFDGSIWDINLNNDLFIPLPHLGYGYDTNGDAVALTVTGGVSEGYDLNGSTHLIDKGAIARNPEKVVNGDFIDGFNGWVVASTANPTLVTGNGFEGNALRLDNPPVVYPQAAQGGIEIEAGLTYRVSLKYRSSIDLNVRLTSGDVVTKIGAANIDNAKFATIDITASVDGTTSFIVVQITATIADWFEFDDVSVTLVVPDYIPNNNEGQPILPLVAGDTFVSGTSFINSSPFVLDMSRPNGAESELIPQPINLNNDWNIVGSAIITDDNTFTTSGGSGGVYIDILEPSTDYIIRSEFFTTASLLQILISNNNFNTRNITTESSNIKFTTGIDEIRVYLRNTLDGVTDLSTFSIKEATPEILIWDKTDPLIWNATVQATANPNNPFEWDSNQLTQAYIDASIESAYHGLVTIELKDGIYAGITYSDDLVKILNRNPHIVVASDIEDFDARVDFLKPDKLVDLSKDTTGVLASENVDLINYARTDITETFDDNVNMLGKVGIGTITPNRKLSVQGVFGVQYDDTLEGLAVNSTSTGVDFTIKNGANGSEFRIDSRSGQRVAWYNGGNFGIGTTDPVAKLSVSNGNISLSNSSMINFYNRDNDNWAIGKDVAPDIVNGMLAESKIQVGVWGSDGQGFQIFDYSNRNSLFEVSGLSGNAYIKGNVGIGTTAPEYELDVRGGVYASNADMGIQIGLPDGQWKAGMFIRSDATGIKRFALDAPSDNIGGKREVLSIDGDGSTTLTGVLQLANEKHIYFRDAANTSYKEVLRFSGDDDVILGQDSDKVYIRTGGVTRGLFSSTGLSVTGQVTITDELSPTVLQLSNTDLAGNEWNLVSSTSGNFYISNRGVHSAFQITSAGLVDLQFGLQTGGNINTLAGYQVGGVEVISSSRDFNGGNITLAGNIKLNSNNKVWASNSALYYIQPQNSQYNTADINGNSGVRLLYGQSVEGLRLDGNGDISITSGDITLSSGAKSQKANGRVSSLLFTTVQSSQYSTERLDLASSSITDLDDPEDGFVKTFFWDTSGRYDAQFYLPSGNGDAKYRSRGGGAFGAWKTFRDTTNFVSGTDSFDYAAGNDSRINNGQTAYNWGDHENAGYMKLYNGSVTTPWDDYTTNGIIRNTSSDVNAPGGGGHATAFTALQEGTGNYGFQISAPDANNFYFRGKEIAWTDWRKVWNDGNSNISTVDWNANNIVAAGSGDFGGEVTVNSTVPGEGLKVTRSGVPVQYIKISEGDGSAHTIAGVGNNKPFRFTNDSTAGGSDGGFTFINYLGENLLSMDSVTKASVFSGSGTFSGDILVGGATLSGYSREVAIKGPSNAALTLIGNTQAFNFNATVNSLSLLDGNLAQSIFAYSTSTKEFIINQNGSARFKTTADGTKTTGTSTAVDHINTSDERLKDFEDSEPIVDVSDTKIRKFTFKSDETKRTHYGVSAQELQKVAPSMVHEDDEGMLSVSYTEFLLAKVSKQDQEIAELKAMVYKLMGDK